MLITRSEIMIYAIDENKVHKIVNIAEAERLDDVGYKIVQADADGWIEWSGGECPLPGSCGVYFKGAAGNIESVTRADMFKETAWKDRGLHAITHYKPILEPQDEQQKEWNGEGLPPVGTVCQTKYGETAHIVAHHIDGLQAIWTASQHGGALFYGTANDFMPLRTDRERWVDAAMDVFRTCSSSNVSGAMGAIYDAGLAKMPGE